ncbi:hypothetical protein GW17_00038132 [Ensete ventricosum]|nr:hypothetical protein GW17_00038132 [Ensete ventricosum]RZR87578.1 hypothetical protein BHM03_00015027 [Ensete ventricosum]
MATSYEGTLRVDVEINLNEGLTRGMVGMRAPSTQCKSRSGATWVELSEVSKPHEGSRLILHGAKDEGSFKAHAPCLRDAFDGGTKAIQLAEVKLGSKGLCMGQEDVEVGTHEKYAIVILSASTNEFHGGLDHTKENNIDVSPAIGWWRSCMGVAVYLFIDQGELLGEHRGVEACGQKGRGSDDESRRAQLPKSKASVRIEVDSEECHSAVEADPSITKKGMQMQDNG